MITCKCKVFLALFLFLGTSVHAWTLDVGEFQFEPVGPDVYVMHGPLTEPGKANRGFMNNPGFVETANGVVLIDPGSTLEVGERILDEITRVTKKPVIAVFNTHIHGDHWLGNQAVSLAFPSIDIYAHEKMIKQANGSQGLSWLDIMDTRTDGLSAGTEILAPDKAVAHMQTVAIDGEHFKIHSFSPTHTDTDIMIEHVESRTLFLGDNSVINRMGRFDGSASILGNLEALEYVAARDFEALVPGHGPSGPSEISVQPYLDYLRKLKQLVEEGFENDMEDYEIKEAAIDQFPEMHDWTGFEERFGVNVNRMYLEIEEREL